MGLAAAAAALTSSEAATAVTLEFAPVTQTVPLGEQVDVSVGISDLGVDAEPTLGTYSIEANFDSSILTLESVSFGDPLLGNQLAAISLFPAVSSVTPSPPTIAVPVTLDELADALGDLDQQAADFILATLTFNTTAAGTSTLNFTDAELVNAGASGGTIVPSLVSGSITVQPAAIPFSFSPGYGVGAIAILAVSARFGKRRC